MREGHKGEKEVGARCLLCDEKRVVGHSREQKKKQIIKLNDALHLLRFLSPRTRDNTEQLMSLKTV